MIRKSCEVNFDVPRSCRRPKRPEAIEELAAEIFREPFDLVQGPLYRVVDLRRAANDHVLVFAIHHAIADGWSLGSLRAGPLRRLPPGNDGIVAKPCRPSR